MSNLFDFFRNVPPFPGMNLVDWQAFRGELWGWLVGSILVVAVTIVGLYAWFSRKIKIRVPQDVFLSFAPLRWLWLAVLPAIVVATVYVARFGAFFPVVLPSPVAGAVGTALAAGFATYGLAQLGIWIPGITPAKFRYHPHWLWWLFQRKGA
jgi:hypothetical protein